MSRNRAAKIFAGLTCGTLLVLAMPSHADKTDVIELANGDHITGEIKELENGILTFSTDHIGKISVEWEQVVHVRSTQVLEIEVTNGERHFGHIAADAADGWMLVTDHDDEAREIEIIDAVRMAPIDESARFRDRVDSYVDFGFSDTKASDVTQYSFDAGFSYRNRKTLWDLTMSTVQSDGGSGRSGSFTVRGERRRFFGNRWFWSGLLQFDQNDEQGLDLRILGGGGMGRSLIQTNKYYVGTLAGLALTREDLDDGGRTDSIEMILGLGYDVFSFAHPNLDLNTSLVVFPSLTVSGRFRTQAQISLNYEIVDDLYIDLSLTEAYDNEPQSTDGQKRDYSISTSLGYKF